MDRWNWVNKIENIVIDRLSNYSNYSVVPPMICVNGRCLWWKTNEIIMIKRLLPPTKGTSIDVNTGTSQVYLVDHKLVDVCDDMLVTITQRHIIVLYHTRQYNTMLCGVLRYNSKQYRVYGMQYKKRQGVSTQYLTRPDVRVTKAPFVNSLAPGRPGCHLKIAIFILDWLIGIFTSSEENALRWMPWDLTDGKSTLVQAMAWCSQATSHYLSQCWPSSMSPYGVTRPQWVIFPEQRGYLSNRSVVFNK